MQDQCPRPEFNPKQTRHFSALKPHPSQNRGGLSLPLTLQQRLAQDRPRVPITAPSPRRSNHKLPPSQSPQPHATHPLGQSQEPQPIPPCPSPSHSDAPAPRYPFASCTSSPLRAAPQPIQQSPFQQALPKPIQEQTPGYFGTLPTPTRPQTSNEPSPPDIQTQQSRDPELSGRLH